MMKIAALLLRTPVNEMSDIAQLPDALERLALPMSRTALLYLMGNEDILRTEGWIPEQETPVGAETYMRDLRDYGVKAEYPVPDFALGKTVKLSSNVLGCRIDVVCANNLVSIGIGEAVLGSLEAFLATSLDHRILPKVDHLQLRVEPSDAVGQAPVLQFADVDGEPVGTITHRMVMECKTKEDALSFPHWMKDTILEIFLRFAAPQDAGTWGKALFDDERALDRALTFSNIPIMLGNLYGDRVLSLANWIDPSDPTYVVKRNDAWPPAPPPEPIKSFGNTQAAKALRPKKCAMRQKVNIRKRAGFPPSTLRNGTRRNGTGPSSCGPHLARTCRLPCWDSLTKILRLPKTSSGHGGSGTAMTMSRMISKSRSFAAFCTTIPLPML